MAELDVEAVKAALDTITKLTGNAPYALGLCLPGNVMHMFSNMSAPGVHMLLHNCTKRAEALAAEAEREAVTELEELAAMQKGENPTQ